MTASISSAPRNRWLCADLIARDVGIPIPVGGNGSGLIAYDSDDITVVLMLAKNCGYHGIALSGQSSPTQRLNGVIERCTVETTRRDGIHMTAQQNFRIDRNWVRDPSNGNPGQYAAIHIAPAGRHDAREHGRHGRRQRDPAERCDHAAGRDRDPPEPAST